MDKYLLIDVDKFINCKQIKFNNKMSEKQLPTRTFTRKKIQNFSYGLNDAIGKGYSSQVFKGRNDANDEPVAVKVIDLKMLKCEINKTLLSSEIDILKSLRNVPNILHLHEVYTTKNNTYIITELCETDLSRKIKKKMTQPQVFHYMSQFINGYSYVYEKELIHRDLKPANLLLTSQNQIKIADFGFGVKAQEVLKPSKYNVGSPLYMAPESLKRNEYSYKTDIWSIGIIFYEMLTCDTPWRAKNEKELLKKIEGQKIDTILNKKNFSPLAKQFLIRALNHDKSVRLDPEELIRFNFKSSEGSILSEKKLNSTLRSGKYVSIIDKTVSPKNMIENHSVEKRIFGYDNSEKKIQTAQKTMNHYSAKDVQNTEKKMMASPTKQKELKKEERKYISKLLIAQVHFCRFLYKLLGRLKESMENGILAFVQNPQVITEVFNEFTRIIKHKIINLKTFEKSNFLNVEKYEEYQETSDFKKLIKISKDYFERYSTELQVYWNQNLPFYVSTKELQRLMLQIQKALEVQVAKLTNPESQIEIYSKDIIILDYLMTCKQLLQMIKEGENYERFARKSRIEEIVEGSTGEINYELYLKIGERARIMLGCE